MQTSEFHPFRSAKLKEVYLASYDRRAEQYWPIVSELRMVETSYGQTFIRVSGADDKPPLVLLPGGNSTSLMWWQNIQPLSDHYKTYAIDNIADFGRSIPAKEIKTPDDFVSWLDELFDALDLHDNINLLGLSYGAWLTSIYAIRFQARLNKMVLLAPAATVLPLGKQFMLRLIIRLIITHRFFTKSLMHWLCEDLHKKGGAGQAVLADAVDDLHTGSRCFQTRKLPKPTVLKDSDLQDLKIPVLYLVGENEQIYPANSAIQRLKTIAPHIKTDMLADAGHDLLFVHPAIINKKIIEFLK